MSRFALALLAAAVPMSAVAAPENYTMDPYHTFPQFEVSHLGFQTETRTVEVTTFSSPTVDVNLRKIPEGRRKSIRGSRSDEDKIVNPGEVNIQPPSM